MEKAVIKATKESTTATWRVELPTAVPEVWALLTTDSGLASWFSELRMGKLGADGHLVFMMTETEQIQMPIKAFSVNQRLGFEWGADQVVFQLTPTENHQTTLELTEVMTQITEHTPRDLAGWTVCLEKLKTVVQGGSFHFSEMLFDELYQDYQDKLN